MNKDINYGIEYKKRLDNEKGKKMLRQVKINYSKEILELLKNSDDNMLFGILDDLGVTKDYLFKCLSLEIDENITFYDQTINSIVKRKKYNNKKSK